MKFTADQIAETLQVENVPLFNVHRMIMWKLIAFVASIAFLLFVFIALFLRIFSMKNT